MINLYDYQKETIEKLNNGSILCASVGSGKSRTALGYYFFKECKGNVDSEGNYIPMEKPKDLYIITTAKKRDEKDWELEAAPFLFSLYETNFVVDSWNNIKKYQNVYGAFFIFDEQRLVGSGAWVKAFYKIANKNHWILLSATPGDSWKDYIPVFIANGFYKNKTDFERQHCVFSRFAKYPKIDRYVGIRTLENHRNEILVNMSGTRHTVPIHEYIQCDYSKELYLRIAKDRWNIYDHEPIKETGKLCYLMRKVVNSDETRLSKVLDILQDHNKAIIFYNFTYELEMLRELLEEVNIPYTEWNGQKHEKILSRNRWCYLVQYTAGAEGWNCITTDTIIFFSLNYSYKIQVQSEGRIDRLNTPYTKLYYYHLYSNSPIDKGILRALKNKKNFNEKSFLGF